MENASKALIMAAEILIGIIILSIGAYLFSNAAQLPKNYNDNLQSQHTAAFNKEFEKFNTNNVSAQDIVTCVNLAEQNNRDYENDVNSMYYITIYLNGTQLNNSEFTKDEKKIEFMSKMEAKNEFPYKCVKVEHSSQTGRIVKMYFVKK